VKVAAMVMLGARVDWDAAGTSAKAVTIVVTGAISHAAVAARDAQIGKADSARCTRSYICGGCVLVSLFVATPLHELLKQALLVLWVTASGARSLLPGERWVDCEGSILSRE
jgi:hypothetical protein